MSEEQIRDVLGAGIGEEPPIVGGPTAVFAGARTRVLRTRALTGVLSAAAVVGVAAGAVVVSGGSGSGSGTAPAASGSPTTSPKVTAAPGVGSNGPFVWGPDKYAAKPAPAPGPGQVPIDGQTIDLLLKQMLPAGITPSNYAGQPAEYGEMAIDDGHGAGRLGLNVQWDMPIGCGDGCTKLGDGSWVIVHRNTDPTGTTNVLEYQVERDYPSGLRVIVGLSNGLDFKKPATVTRTLPALTVEQLTAIVNDPRWTVNVPKSLADEAKKDIKPYNNYNK